MAWAFSLSSECGSDEEQAKQFAQHFKGVSWVISNNDHYQCRVDRFQDIEENWWCRIRPNTLSNTGINTPENAYAMTELGILLYEKLKSAPLFRYALVGIEVDEFRTFSELSADPSVLHIPGLVLAADLAQGFSDVSDFRPFSPGYIWQPYAGEIYNPLMTSTELKSKLNALLIVG